MKLALTLFKALAWAGIACMLMMSLFENTLNTFGNDISWIHGWVLVVVSSSQTQWAVSICIFFYTITLILIRSRFLDSDSLKDKYKNALLIVFLIAGLNSYFIDYLTSSLTLDQLILYGSIALGLFVAMYTFAKQGGNAIVFFLVLLLSTASLWNIHVRRIYQYREDNRWSGPWGNPNIYGVLMGAGVVLALGRAMQPFVRVGKNIIMRMAVKRRSVLIGEYAITGVSLLAFVLMTRGLLHSYSRGAWLGALGSLIYLAVFNLQIQNSKLIMRIRRNGLCLIIIVISLFVLNVFYLPQTKWHLSHRILSTINLFDFSWRNRIAGWEGALQIMTEHPWLGVGWNGTERSYEHYYLSPKLSESAAIETNDYLLLGATLGIPALFCFGMYVWLSITRRGRMRSAERGVRISNDTNEEGAYLDWLQTTCRAGAVVLLAGFWFDGGLFKLPTASVFWILLELGSLEPRRESKEFADKNIATPVNA